MRVHHLEFAGAELLRRPTLEEGNRGRNISPPDHFCVRRAEHVAEQAISRQGCQRPEPRLPPGVDADRADTRHGDQSNSTRAQDPMQGSHGGFQIVDEMQGLGHDQAIERAGRHAGRVGEVRHEGRVRITRVDIQNV